MDRQRRTSATRPGPDRVVVVGASLAGLFAAAAAAGRGRTVTVLERDVLPAGPQPRSGVPQGRQPHVFLYRGLLALEQLLPGLRAELLDAGAVPLDTGELAWLGETGWAPVGTRQFEIVSASRAVFEHHVLRRVRAHPGVRIRDGTRVVALHRGERAEAPWRVQLGDGSLLDADLVVDASGRGSRLPLWLAGCGVGPVRTTEVDARTGYATREYAVAPGQVLPAGVVLQQTPQTLAGGLALPVEGGRWLVAAVGSGDRRPPRDEHEFAAFLSALADPALAELTACAVPVSDVSVHRQTGNRRHHYERLRSWPSGLLVVGDAFCTFNPVYGQGVTVAACQAVLLQRALRAGLPRPGAQRRLLRRFAAVVALPWAIATGEDLRYPTSDAIPSVMQDRLSRWTRELGRLSAHGNVRAQRSTARVYHLMAPPWVLFHPALLAAAARARVRGYGPAAPRPRIVAWPHRPGCGRPPRGRAARRAR